MFKGIDVSEHQSKIDWKKVKSSGIDFAILRAGFGREVNQKDVRFEENYTACKTNNIPVGAYWYSYAVTPEQAQKEAETCLQVLKNKKFEYPIYFDIENKQQLALSAVAIQKIALAFCDILEAAGYWVGIYSYKYFLETNFTEEILKRYTVWVAHIGVDQTDFEYPHQIWQYSHTGKLDGINTDVDLNFAYEDYPVLMKLAGLNGYSKNDELTYSTHTVAKNETLWGIAEKYLGSGLDYPVIKSLNKLSSNTIFPDQVLKIPKK